MHNIKKALDKNKFFTIMSFTLLQITIFYANRSQVSYFATHGYHFLYVTVFSCIYPFGFICGSIFNQYLFVKFGRKELYVFLFSLVSLFLLFNNIYKNKFCWWFFRFGYSFVISGLLWIADLNFFTNSETPYNLPTVIIKTYVIRISNLLSGFLLSWWDLEYYQVITTSAILLQLSQIFFTLEETVKNKKSIKKLTYYFSVLNNGFAKNYILTILFFFFNGVNGVILTCLLIISNSLKEKNFYVGLVPLSFIVGEGIACYIFNTIPETPNLKRNIFLEGVIFGVFNILLFSSLKYEYYKVFFFSIFIIGGLTNRLGKNIDKKLFQYNSKISKEDFDFTSTLNRNLLTIISSLILIPITMYFKSMIFFGISAISLVIIFSFGLHSEKSIQ